MPQNLPSGLIKELENYIFNSSKLVAIKTYKEHTGCDLRHAKKVIDAMEAKLRQSHPDKLTFRVVSYEKKKNGCMKPLAIALCGLVAALALILIWQL